MQQFRTLSRTSGVLRPERVFQKLEFEIQSALNGHGKQEVQHWLQMYPNEFQENKAVWTKTREQRIKNLIKQLSSHHLQKFLPFDEFAYDGDIETILKIADLLLPKVGWNKPILKGIYIKIDDDLELENFEPNIFELNIVGGRNCSSILKKNKDIAINRRNKNGETPIFYAVMANNLQCINCLLDLGVDINQLNLEGYPPLTRALSSNRLECFKLLVNRGANFDLSYEDMPIFNYICQYLTPDFVSFLLEKGADPNRSDPNGFSPLMLSIWNEDHYMEIAKLLIDAGADVLAKTKQGETALTIAVSEENDAAMLIYDTISRIIKEELKEIGFILKQNQREKFQQQVLDRNLTCPITGQVMTRPVLNSVQSVYDQNSIKKWHQKNTRQRIKDPSKGVTYTDKNLTKDFNKIVLVEQFLRKKLAQLVTKQQRQKQRGQRQQMIIQDQRPLKTPSSDLGVQQTKRQQY